MAYGTSGERDGRDFGGCVMTDGITWACIVGVLIMCIVNSLQRHVNQIYDDQQKVIDELKERIEALEKRT